MLLYIYFTLLRKLVTRFDAAYETDFTTYYTLYNVRSTFKKNITKGPFPLFIYFLNPLILIKPCTSN